MTLFATGPAQPPVPTPAPGPGGAPVPSPSPSSAPVPPPPPPSPLTTSTPGLEDSGDFAGAFAEFNLAQQEAAEAGVKTAQAKNDDDSNRRKLATKQVYAWIQKAAAAAESSSSDSANLDKSNQLDLGLAIGGAVLAVIAAVASGGAATPLAIAAVMGVTATLSATTYGLDKQGVTIAPPEGGEARPINLNPDGLTALAVGGMQSVGWINESKEQLATTESEAGTGVEIAIAVALIVAGGYSAFGGGMKAAEGAEKGAKEEKLLSGLSKLAPEAESVSQTLQIGTDTAQGGNMIYSGTVTLDLANVDKDSTEANAQKDYLNNIVKQLGADRDLWNDIVKNRVDAMSDIQTSVMNSINAMLDARLNSGNLVIKS